jgi:hypothetical protein
MSGEGGCSMTRGRWSRKAVPTFPGNGGGRRLLRDARTAGVEKGRQHSPGNVGRGRLLHDARTAVTESWANIPPGMLRNGAVTDRVVLASENRSRATALRPCSRGFPDRLGAAGAPAQTPDAPFYLPSRVRQRCRDRRARLTFRPGLSGGITLGQVGQAWRGAGSTARRAAQRSRRSSTGRKPARKGRRTGAWRGARRGRRRGSLRR